MKKYSRSIAVVIGMIYNTTLLAASLIDNQAKTANGILVGTFNPATGVRSFKGIPFAQPPVGQLRWKPPLPPGNWDGLRKADKFGPRAMQRNIFGDMIFRSEGMSEDCLYLNVWTPAKTGKERLPVLVYFYGGGFQAGDGSESRYDGESMAHRGIVAITVNYRLNVFGFLAHPELSQESPEHASGNYGLLDQNAALRWVAQNISVFGGDPARVTIAGESAGSISVSAHMVSPMSRGLFAGAIGESGSLLGALPPAPLDNVEQIGLKFATNGGANSLAELRAMPAEKVLEATAKPGAPWFSLAIDGLFITADPWSDFAAGKQAKVPLLVGWNSEEMNSHAVLGPAEPTVENFQNAVKRLYPNDWEAALKAYSASDPSQVIQVATDLASDRFIAYSTWKWADAQSKTSEKSVYRYYYSHPRPATKTQEKETNAGKQAPHGAVHSGEIEYALGNLDKNSDFAWTPDDHKVSEIMQSYFTNFIKNGNPNGSGLAKWPSMGKGRGVSFLRLDTMPKTESELHVDRYLFLDQHRGK